MAISRAIELVASNVTKIEIQKIIINKKNTLLLFTQVAQTGREYPTSRRE